MYDIIGSGIAGLTCSHILSKSNISHSILEKETSSPEDHYGIQITPNASKILAKMGLLDSILPDMHVINNIEIISLRNLKTLTRLPVNEFVLNNNLSKYYTISRKILYEHL
ncbi:MAG: NAD(P)-binding protein, partial [Hyphomicrobiales bacterium]